MKVLSIGTDRKLFEDSSTVLSRMISYASKVEEMHIIVFTKKGFREKNIGNLHIHPTNSVNPLYYIFDAIKIGEEIIKNNNLSLTNSVLSTQDPFETGVVGYFLHKRHFLPFQVQVHTDFLSSHFKIGFINKIRVFIARFVIQKAQGIRVVSDVIKESVKNKFPKLSVNIEVLPIFVDIQNIVNFVPNESAKKVFSNFKFTIFMASRLAKEKRINIALKVLKNIVIEFPKTGLVIAGNGPELVKLKKLTDKLSLQNNVVFIGWQNDIVSYLKEADLFLLTSEYEGYGMTLVEAGASGCPIVTTEVGLAKTSLFKNNENSLVCPVGDIKCIEKSVSSLIHDNSKRELFKRKLQESLINTSISFDDYTTKYVNILKSMLTNV
ncbi:MAG: glycogen(starch) synthase [Parcubacteria bacterium C7867-006]|nr:MAG: glycogen(starch) synthase [Parcubacteria bacterium C7867-006]